MRVLSLFSGIGGLDLGFKMHYPEAQTIMFCEIEEYPRQVLVKRFPGIPIWEDVYTLTADDLPVQPDWIIGGFPCQAFSHAGKREGFDDHRGELFFEITRLAREVREKMGHLPQILAENVPGILSIDGGRTFADILGELAEVGYDVRWEVVGAWEAGAPHKRDRVWILAHPNATGR